MEAVNLQKFQTPHCFSIVSFPSWSKLLYIVEPRNHWLSRISILSARLSIQYSGIRIFKMTNISHLGSRSSWSLWEFRWNWSWNPSIYFFLCHLSFFSSRNWATENFWVSDHKPMAPYQEKICFKLSAKKAAVQYQIIWKVSTYPFDLIYSFGKTYCELWHLSYRKHCKGRQLLPLFLKKSKNHDK